MSEKQKKTGKETSALSFIAKIPTQYKLIILGVIAVIFSIAFPILSNRAGRMFGSTVGAAVGSFQAVTQDMPAAYHQGKEDGLSANDTRTEIESQIRDIGILEVLAANATLTDFHQKGDDYDALYELGADVIFSIDMTQAKVLMGENEVEIILPKPVAQINLDSNRTRLLAESSRIIFNGSSEDGITAYMNSMRKIQVDAKNSLDDYGIMQQMAEESATRQVSMLVKMAMGDTANVTVRFEEMAGENNE